ncbi:membrane protein [Tenacibaculum sp. 47A_GOM-205m]|uniref:membrane protein n=1 Tax=Tenacibaculum sp. 47A_GOM-205m TaxID=1380384 RepID=UPI00048E151E|nr:membrane protein [Tenacibaculum sp. 47A_GOM-205m]
MKFFKTVIDFYINASIHVALAVYALLRITEIYFEIPHNELLDWFVFFATITGYNFVKYAGVAKLHHRSLTKNLQVIQVFSLICFLLMCYFAWLLPLKILLFFVPFGLLTFLYAVPFLSGFQKNLRSIGYLKIIVVAAVWVGTTVLLPVYAAESSFTTEVCLSIIQRFLLIIILLLPFDIRDVQYDAISLQTIPKKIGVENTKKFGYVLLLLCLVLEFMISPNSHFRTAFLSVFFLILFLLMRAQTNQSKYYSSFWVEAVPVLWLLLLFLL